MFVLLFGDDALDPYPVADQRAGQLVKLLGLG